MGQKRGWQFFTVGLQDNWCDYLNLAEARAKQANMVLPGMDSGYKAGTRAHIFIVLSCFGLHCGAPLKSFLPLFERNHFGFLDSLALALAFVEGAALEVKPGVLIQLEELAIARSQPCPQ